MLPPITAERETKAAGGALDFPTLLFDVLGFTRGEYVSICHSVGDGPFKTEVCASEDAPAKVAELPANADIYFGVNPVTGPARKNAGRGTKVQTTRPSALVADLDVKPGACSNMEVALAIVDELSSVLGSRPVACTRSGGGLHAYWPLNDDDEIVDGSYVDALWKRWGRLVKAVAKKHGVKADSVFDLPRVLRVPGTYNNKGASNGRSGVLAVCYTDNGRPLTLMEINDQLDAAGIPEVDGDRDATELKSNPAEWEFADKTCKYMVATISGWADVDAVELGQGRHQWLLSAAVRLNCARMLCCVSESDYEHAKEVVETTFRHFRATREPIKPVTDYEIEAAWAYGIERAAMKTDGQARAELGGHKHGRSDSKTQSKKLVELALEEYGLGVTPGGKSFAYRRSAPHVALDLKGGKLGLRQQLADDYYTKYDAVPAQNSLQQAMTVLEGKAHKQPPTELHVRVAGGSEAIHIDMADEGNRIIEISGGSWRIVGESPYRFRRTELIAAMPEPGRDGDLKKLWRFVNIADADKALLVAVMADALIQPDTPKPVIGLIAEHGCAKTSTARCIGDLIDRSTAGPQAPPRDPTDWATTASPRWAVALDNLSRMPEWLSDAICRASTGDAFVRRQLYTDESVVVSKFRRAVILTGIDMGGLSPDLTDRLVLVQLKPIGESDRVGETELQEAWRTEYPDIFGALLDLAAEVHAKLPTIGEMPLPRMADFGRVIVCVDEIAGSDGIGRYRERLKRALVDSANSDPFIEQLINARYDTRDDPKGKTSAKILVEVSRPIVGGSVQNWPRSGRNVTKRLRNFAPALRQVGWTVANDDGENHDKIIRWTLYPPKTEREESDDTR
jgi:hypothetical protein